MTIINDNTVVVFSSDELKTVLEKDNSYNYIYFGSNISLTSGIKIASTKSNIIIDGTYDGTTYTFTDMKTLNTGDTISATYQTISKVVVKNLNITGNNYYGVIYVPDTASLKNIIVEYNNITYTGPQISFHPTGLTRFIDSSITIGDTSLTTGNEVAECNKVELGGITVINHSSKSNSSFWFRNANPSLTVLKNSKVTFTSESRELFYGPNDLAFTVASNSTFDVTTYNGMAYGTFGTGTTLIDENASFTLKQTNRNGSYATWYSYGVITLNNNSSLTIINNFTNISSNNYNISFQTANSGLVLNNPNMLLLYNTTANIISTTTTIPFTFNYSRLNLFNNSIPIDDNISKSTLPTYSWYKDDAISTVIGTVNKTTTSITSHNYTTEELENLPDLKELIFPNKKVFSIGTIPLKIHALSDTDTVMSGKTSPNASLLIEYDNASDVIVADSLGNFSYSYDSPLPIGTKITFNVKEANNLIYRTKTIEIVYSGELTIDSVPDIISFNLNPIRLNPILCPKNEKLIITVTDSRIDSTPWNLFASINNELENEDNNVLKDSLVFLDSNNNINIISTTKTLIYQGEGNDGSTKTTEIIFDKDEGILFQVLETLIANTEYKTKIIWSLEENT